MTTIILFKPLTARGGRYYYLQFTEEETEAQRVGIWGSHFSLLTPMPALGGQGRLPNYERVAQAGALCEKHVCSFLHHFKSEFEGEIDHCFN